MAGMHVALIATHLLYVAAAALLLRELLLLRRPVRLFLARLRGDRRRP